jgi:hypothetical protein
MMRKNGLPILTQTVVTCLVILLTSAVVYGGTSLYEKFDTLCIQPQEAESLSLEKLQELMTKCDHLQKK